MGGQRDTWFNPHPMYDMPGFGIDALDANNIADVSALTDIGVDTTSAAIQHGGNAIAVSCLFSDAVTSCHIDVTDSVTSALLITFHDISLTNKPNRYVGFFDNRVEIHGHPVTIRAYNFVGGGTVSVLIRRTTN